jgi:hypothetical protein
MIVLKHMGELVARGALRNSYSCHRDWPKNQVSRSP